jgi:predicted dehydrogenase
VYANFHRTSGAPVWSGSGWFMRAEESGGVLDMHIHDIDVALWWFGRPKSIQADGVKTDGLPVIVDAKWEYDGGPLVKLHSVWDRNGGPFRHAFTLVLEKATLAYDNARDPAALHVHEGGKTTTIPLDDSGAYVEELSDFARSCAANTAVATFTPADSRLAVEIGLEELRQLGC